MPYPQRPQIPNPYQIAGQAAQELGSQARQFGQDEDALRERFRLMMEKRAEAELKKQQRDEDLQFKRANEEREAGKVKTEADKAAKAAKVRMTISERLNNPEKPLTRQDEADLYLSEGLDLPVRFATPDVERPAALPSSLQEYEYAKKQGFKGTFQDFTASQRPPRVESQLPEQRLGLQEQGQRFQQENALRDEFNKKTVPFETARTAYDKMYGAIQSNNPADAYAAVIDFVKTLDPGSTVREGEYTTAKSAGAGGSYGRLKQSIRNLYDGKMTPEVRQNLLEAGRNLMAAEQASYDRIRKDYKGRVENYNQRGVNLDTTAVLSTYPEIQGLNGNSGKSSMANDKTFNSFQEAAALPVGTGFWVNGKHYTKGQN